ncbi:MAG: transporter related [Acidimicrobiaceae bacterium]|nr:transporter related [Acidimicrobiaceae bacterium]
MDDGLFCSCVILRLYCLISRDICNRAVLVANLAPVTALVEARGLVKVYAPKDRKSEPFTAVDGIDFTLHRGEVFGFLGPNGAGKSSTMRMLSCVSPVTGGTISILGMDAATDGRAIRSRLGVVAQDDALDNELTVRENLLIYGLYFGLSKAVASERASELLQFAQLEERAADRVSALSGGMRRRLSIARSLLNRPDVLLLDEPTTGLDPQARHILWDKLYQLKQQGVTLVLTTHYMDEAEQLCDRLVVMHKGKIVAEGSPRQLIEAYASREVLELRFAVTAEAAPADKIREADLCHRLEVLPGRLVCSTDDGERTLAGAHRLGIRPDSAIVRRSSLEDVFLSLTGRSLVD